jgi:hypothetical protein
MASCLLTGAGRQSLPCARTSSPSAGSQTGSQTFDPAHLFPTLGAAVSAFRQETGDEWPASTSQPHDISAPPAGLGGVSSGFPSKPTYQLSKWRGLTMSRRKRGSRKNT